MNRTVLRNEMTGANEVIYESRRTSFQFWVTIVTQMLVIAGVVFGAVKFGLRAETREAIEHELSPPNGVIHMSVEKCVKEEIEPMKNKVLIMDVRQKNIADDIGEIKTAVKEIAKNGG